MNSLIIFGIFLGLYVVLAGVAHLIDLKDEVDKKRIRNRMVFLANHPNYTEDDEGNLVKRQ